MASSCIHKKRVLFHAQRMFLKGLSPQPMKMGKSLEGEVCKVLLRPPSVLSPEQRSWGEASWQLQLLKKRTSGSAELCSLVKSTWSPRVVKTIMQPEALLSISLAGPLAHCSKGQGTRSWYQSHTFLLTQCYRAQQSNDCKYPAASTLLLNESTCWSSWKKVNFPILTSPKHVWLAATIWMGMTDSYPH